MESPRRTKIGDIIRDNPPGRGVLPHSPLRSRQPATMNPPEAGTARGNDPGISCRLFVGEDTGCTTRRWQWRGWHGQTCLTVVVPMGPVAPQDTLKLRLGVPPMGPGSALPQSCRVPRTPGRVPRVLTGSRPRCMIDKTQSSTSPCEISLPLPPLRRGFLFPCTGGVHALS
jgi:hypothetical protein